MLKGSDQSPISDDWRLIRRVSYLHIRNTELLTNNFTEIICDDGLRVRLRRKAMFFLDNMRTAYILTSNEIKSDYFQKTKFWAVVQNLISLGITGDYT